MAKSWGHIGCSADVLDLIDTDSSAKRKCLFTVSTLRDRILPCPTDLILYLEARYKCIDGEYWTTTPKLTCCGEICILYGFPSEIRYTRLICPRLDCPPACYFSIRVIITPHMFIP